MIFLATFLSSLQSLALYIGVIALGVFLGSRKAVRGKNLKWLSTLQTFALIFLILALGVEIGADEQVISSLGTIGLSALVVTLLALIGSVAAVFGIRKLLRLDREGRKAGAKEGDRT